MAQNGALHVPKCDAETSPCTTTPTRAKRKRAPSTSRRALLSKTGAPTNLPVLPPFPELPHRADLPDAHQLNDLLGGLPRLHFSSVPPVSLPKKLHLMVPCQSFITLGTRSLWPRSILFEWLTHPESQIWPLRQWNRLPICWGFPPLQKVASMRSLFPPGTCIIPHFGPDVNILYFEFIMCDILSIYSFIIVTFFNRL